MNRQENKDYTFTFESTKPLSSIFETLLDVKQWWSGIYHEEINGKSKNLNDEFTFSAGGGAHYSRQRLINIMPNKKISWLVIESNLSFLKNTSEWTSTIIDFQILDHNAKRKITFTHEGLIPKIECFKSCTDAWTGYMENLAEKLK